MKPKTMVIVFLLTMFCNTVFAETIYVGAIENCLGPNGGTYKHVSVKEGVTYEIMLESNNAIFNTNDGARIVNIGVMYVQPPRKMTMKIIEANKKTYVETEGNLYFFFVDDALLNSGGAGLNIREVNAPTFTIAASAGTGGTINPSGSISVNIGESKTFSIFPKACYDTDKILVNGSPVTLTDGQYTFTDVTADQTVSVTFKQNSCCTDSDNDGIPDQWDKCPDTPSGSIVDSTGCPVTVYTQAQLDQKIADAKASMYTQTQLDAAKQESFQKGIQSCKDNPADCALFTEAQLKQAVKDEQLKWDANGDGRIGLEDIIYMLQVIAGLRP